MSTRRQSRPMSTDQCWALLKRKNVGRLSVSINNEPDVFPVSYAVDDETLVIRTNPGLKLAAAALGPAVAFEVDELDEMRQLGASVVIKGRAEEIERLDELIAADELMVEPWEEEGKSRYLRVQPRTVTGREIVAPTRENGSND